MTRSRTVPPSGFSAASRQLPNASNGFRRQQPRRAETIAARCSSTVRRRPLAIAGTPPPSPLCRSFARRPRPSRPLDGRRPVPNNCAPPNPFQQHHVTQPSICRVSGPKPTAPAPTPSNHHHGFLFCSKSGSFGIRARLHVPNNSPVRPRAAASAVLPSRFLRRCVVNRSPMARSACAKFSQA